MSYLPAAGRSRTTVGKPRPPRGCRSRASAPAGIVLVSFNDFREGYSQSLAIMMVDVPSNGR